MAELRSYDTTVAVSVNRLLMGDDWNQWSLDDLRSGNLAPNDPVKG